MSEFDKFLRFIGCVHVIQGQIVINYQWEFYPQHLHNWYNAHNGHKGPQVYGHIHAWIWASCSAN